MAGSDDLLAGLADMNAARPQYDDAWAFWAGSRDEEFVSPAVKRALRMSEGRYQINVSKVAVNALAHRLEISQVLALAKDGNRDPAADDVLQAILTANQMKLQWNRLLRNALVYGDACLFLWPRGEDTTAPGDTAMTGEDEPLVTIAYNSPLVARVIYDPENDMRVLYQIKSWTDRNGRVYANIYYPGSHVEKWVLEDNAKPEDPRGWDRVPGSDDIPMPLGAGLYHFRTDMPYGTPVHQDGWGPQDAINKISTTMTHSTEAAGFPQRWALTDPAAALNGDAGDAPDWDDDADSDIITEDDSRLRGGPGELSILAGIKATGEWSSANAQAFIDPLDAYVRMMALTTATPMRYIDQRGGAPSGESLRVADAPLLSRVANTQLYLDSTARACMTGVLTLAGITEPRVDVRWRPPGIVDDTTTWQLAQMKVASGVPARVALAETGLYEQDEIDAWLADADDGMDLGRRVSLLGTFATAVQALSQGVAVGTVSQPQVDAVVSAVLGQLTPPADDVAAE